MHVLLVSTSEQSGGGAIAARRLMEALNKNGVKARMMVRDKQTDATTVCRVGHKLQKLLERLAILPHISPSKGGWGIHHPPYVIEHVAYRHRAYRIMGWMNPMIKVGRSFEELFLNLRYGNFRFILTAIRNRINKWMGKEAYK